MLTLMTAIIILKDVINLFIRLPPPPQCFFSDLIEKRKQVVVLFPGK